MRLSYVRIENFRNFGEEAHCFELDLPVGIAALVGENDSGKTAVVDAVRLALGTRGQDFFRVAEGDFHQPADGSGARREIRIMLRFEELNRSDCGAFVEHLTWLDDKAQLFVHWSAVAGKRGSTRKFIAVECRSGERGDGPALDAATRALLCTTYLRPLRDANQALSAGRGSRLAQILEQTSEVRSEGIDYDPADIPDDLSDLSVLGIGDFANDLLERQSGIVTARNRLNDDYLAHLSFAGDLLKGAISVGGARGDRGTRLRQLLEKLELDLRDDDAGDPPPSRGLGSNNLLFMASELLLLEQDSEGFPSLIVEEPEAHLHPQRQVRLMDFLRAKAAIDPEGGQGLQVLMTTHSPVLAASLSLDSLVLVRGGKAYPMGHDHTKLDASDYRFLERFLDATKANLFFARGVVIVEGDGEAILLPTLARLIDRDFSAHGVSLVNVGGTGLRRYARIFQRCGDDRLDIPVACIADMDVMPACAPAMLGLLREDGTPPPNRRWHSRDMFTDETLAARHADIAARADGQSVRTFVADHWTLEYDLAFSGIGREMWLAACLADQDDRIHRDRVTRAAVLRAGLKAFAGFEALSPEEKAVSIYARFHEGASKAIAAQYLAALLMREEHRKRDPVALRAKLPRYLVDAIDYVTRHGPGLA